MLLYLQVWLRHTTECHISPGATQSWLSNFDRVQNHLEKIYSKLQLISYRCDASYMTTYCNTWWYRIGRRVEVGTLSHKKACLNWNRYSIGNPVEFAQVSYIKICWNPHTYHIGRRFEIRTRIELEGVLKYAGVSHRKTFWNPHTYRTCIV